MRYLIDYKFVIDLDINVADLYCPKTPQRLTRQNLLPDVEISKKLSLRILPTLSMGIYRQVIEWMNDLNSSDFGVMFSFITMIAGIISSTKFLFRFYGKHSHPIKTYSFLFVILFIGLIFPTSILLSTDWVGWKHILLNVVAIYGLFSFFMLLYIIRTMMSLGKRKSVSV